MDVIAFDNNVGTIRNGNKYFNFYNKIKRICHSKQCNIIYIFWIAEILFLWT